MQKILISELQKVNKIRQVIKAEINGVIVDIVIKNPVGEEGEMLYDAVTTILDGDVYSYNGKEITEDNLIEMFIEVLTNVEIDSFNEGETHNNIALVEMLSTVNEIYSEVVITIYANLTAIYNRNKIDSHKDKFIHIYQDFLKRQEAEKDMEQKEDVEE